MLAFGSAFSFVFEVVLAADDVAALGFASPLAFSGVVAAFLAASLDFGRLALAFGLGEVALALAFAFGFGGAVDAAAGASSAVGAGDVAAAVADFGAVAVAFEAPARGVADFGAASDTAVEAGSAVAAGAVAPVFGSIAAGVGSAVVDRRVRGRAVDVIASCSPRADRVPEPSTPCRAPAGRVLSVGGSAARVTRPKVRVDLRYVRGGPA